MKPRMRHPRQDDRQWQEARALLDADPGYATWSETSHAADAMTFDEWLNTPEGQAWLDEAAALDRFQRNGFHDLESWDYAAMGA